GGPEFGFFAGADKEIDDLTAQLLGLRRKAAGEEFTADAMARSAEETKKRINALEDWGEINARNLSNEAKQRKEIERIRSVGLAAGKNELEIQEQIDAYLARVVKKTGVKNDAATRLLLSLREQEASLRAQLDTSGKLGAQQAALAKFEQQIA